jgi:LysR family hydrogen peroxide-inducible transcriptional activator
MNIHQFQYIIALAEHKHFEKAAESCFITQSTLSTMISKFEDEIGIMVFDRKKKPVEVTLEGFKIIEQLKKIGKEIDQLKSLSQQIKGEETGNLSIAVIPTIAPFLLPRFLHHFASQFPKLEIEVTEQTTAEIIRQIKSRDLDIGIVSIPIDDTDLIEIKLYDEPFVLYDAVRNDTEYIHTKEIDISNLCLLEEGHCMRTQVLELCDFHQKQIYKKLNFRYKAGSIDSLLRFVKANDATTLLPYLSILDFSENEMQKISRFSNPVPYRTVGLVVHRHFVKKKILELLELEINQQITAVLPENEMEGKMLRPV